MKNIFKMELLRHSHWMVIAAAVHFVVLYYLFWLNTSFTNGIGALAWLLGICVFGGAFGAIQMKLYKRGNDWTYLLHRPLAPGSIHVGLILAGSVVLAITLLLPALLMIVIMQIDGRFGTELRHYKMLGLGTTVAFTAYGVGQYAVLGASRLAFLAVVFVCVFVYEPFGDIERLVTNTFVMLCALGIAHIAFRNDLDRLPASLTRLLLTELPIVLGSYMVISLVFGIYLISQRTSSTLFGNSTPDTFWRLAALSGAEQLQFSLKNSTHPDAGFLAQQTVLGEVELISPPRRASYPARHQLPMRDNKLSLLDMRDNTSWLFSHSAMLYVGRDIASDAQAGWLGPDGFHAADAGMPQERFSSVPLAVTNDYVVDDHSIYQIDWEQKKISKRFTIADDERFSDSLFISEHLATILSDRRLFIFSAPDLADTEIALMPRASLELSFPVADGEQVPGGTHVMELINGYLVSAFIDLPPSSNIPEFTMQNRAKLQVWRLLPGSTELITSLPVRSSYSEFSLYADLVLAPGVRTITDIFWGFKLRSSNERTFSVLYADLPRWVIFSILFVSIGCAGFTAFLLRKSRLPARIHVFWIVLSAFSGLPGLVSFLLGHYWRGRDRLRLPLPAGKVQRVRVPA